MNINQRLDALDTQLGAYEQNMVLQQLSQNLPRNEQGARLNEIHAQFSELLAQLQSQNYDVGQMVRVQFIMNRLHKISEDSGKANQAFLDKIKNLKV